MRATETRVPELPDEVLAVLHQARVRGSELPADVAAALDEARVRGGAAWDALRGERVGPPTAARRWPVALTAAIAGAAAGAAVALVLRRLRTQDAPGALEPEQVEAVVDRVPGPV